MITPEYTQLMAAYNQWMNDKLYAICAELSDEERKQDRKAYFKSIHGTLNHLLLGDRAWMGRFEGRPFIFNSLDEELFADFSELRAERQLTDARIVLWSRNMSMADLSGEFRFMSVLMPGIRSCKMWRAVAHMFNHQTHHRGQLTALLSQLGIDPGVTDLMFMPGVLSNL